MAGPAEASIRYGDYTTLHQNRGADTANTARRLTGQCPDAVTVGCSYLLVTTLTSWATHFVTSSAPLSLPTHYPHPIPACHSLSYSIRSTPSPPPFLLPSSLLPTHTTTPPLPAPTAQTRSQSTDRLLPHPAPAHLQAARTAKRSETKASAKRPYWRRAGHL